MGWTSSILSGLFVLLAATYIVPSTGVKYDTSFFPPHYKAIEGNYTPRGGEYQIGNLTVYESQNRAAKRLVIAVHDIMSLSTNIKQVVDSLAEMYDFRVVLPDFFRGTWWDNSNWPPENPEDLEEFIQRNASWENIVKYDLYNVINTFRSRDNITEVGIFGLCWGGIVSVLAATEIEEIKVAAIVHPTYVTDEHAPGVKAPMFLMPATNDPDMRQFYEVLKQNFGDNSGHRRFEDMMHAFAGAGGNFSNPLNAQRVEQVIDIIGIFFNRNLHA